ncbi:MAG TPA: hypothetical protein VFJ19_17390 [Nocardioidaceae bacterium]|nr:hypothetical protein [Nocardioidaceae bacterium]
MFAHGVTVTVERPGGTDRYGNPLPSTFHAVTGCAFAPRGESDEDNADRRAEVITSLSMFAADGADLAPQDVVIDPTPYTGKWQVEGDAAVWRNPYTGRTAGIAAVLKRVGG